MEEEEEKAEQQIEEGSKWTRRHREADDDADAKATEDVRGSAIRDEHRHETPRDGVTDNIHDTQRDEA